MLYERTRNEIALRAAFTGNPQTGEEARPSGNWVVLLHQNRRDCDAILEGLAEREVAYLPSHWYDAETVARRQSTGRHASLAAYLGSVIGGFPDTVVTPVEYSEFFALLRLGLFGEASSELTFAMLGRRRGVDDAAGAYLDMTRAESLTLSQLDDAAFVWLLDRSFTLPQEREIVRSFLELRRFNAADLRFEQWRSLQNRFYDRLLKRVAAVNDTEQPDGDRDAERRNLEVRIAAWVQDKTTAMMGDWAVHGWPEPANAPNATGPNIGTPPPAQGTHDRMDEPAVSPPETRAERPRRSLLGNPFASR